MIRMTPQELKRKDGEFHPRAAPRTSLDEVEIESRMALLSPAAAQRPRNHYQQKSFESLARAYSATKLEQRLRRAPAGRLRYRPPWKMIASSSICGPSSPEQEPLLIKTLAAVAALAGAGGRTAKTWPAPILAAFSHILAWESLSRLEYATQSRGLYQTAILNWRTRRL